MASEGKHVVVTPEAVVLCVNPDGDNLCRCTVTVKVSSDAEAKPSKRIDCL